MEGEKRARRHELIVSTSFALKEGEEGGGKKLSPLPSEHPTPKVKRGREGCLRTEMGLWWRLMACLSVVAAVDAVAAMRLRRGGCVASSVRWFLLHGCVNVVNVLLCLPALASLLCDPYSACVDQSAWSASKWPLTLTVALHVYHVVGGFRLTTQDLAHHLIFMPTVGVPGMVYDWGCLGNWFAFFVCGLPGAVDYLLLAAQKTCRAKEWNQKKVSALLNVWVRMPGVLVGVGVGYLLTVQGRHFAPKWAMVMQLICLPANALYYAEQSVVNRVFHSLKPLVPASQWKLAKQAWR